MIFNSMSYLCFFPVVVLLYFVFPKKVRFLWLLAASYYFYMCWNPKYILLLLSATVITWICGMLIQKSSSIVRKRSILAIGIALELGMLFYFKYLTFAVNNINFILGKLHRPLLEKEFDILLPVGISFYIFQTIGYMIDVYRKKVAAEKNFLMYALFVSFFPQLVAGPIERTGNMMHQLKAGTDFDVEKVRHGLLLILWGILLKVALADNLAPIVTEVYHQYSSYTGIYIVIATMLFAIQIYCDFGGYSYIAIGSAEVLGYRLMENFKSPYFAGSVSEFWRRWHISLTSWFTDYVYISLGGNRKGTVRKYINNFIVFTLSGVWHGAQWTYIVWGMLNSFLIMLEKLSAPLRKKLTGYLHIKATSYWYQALQRVTVFVLISFTWLFFRAASLTDAWAMIQKIFGEFGLRSLWLPDGVCLLLPGSLFVVIAVLMLLLFAFDWCQYHQIDVMGKILDQNFFVRYVCYAALIGIVVIFGNYGGDYEQTQFIYFQF